MQYKKEEIRQNILNCAMAEFKEEGYLKASILKIAKKAKVSVGNLYRYFKSKQDLFEQIVKNTVEELPEVIKKIYESQMQENRNLKKIADNIAEHIMRLNEKYGKQILILIDKSSGSKYENYYNKFLTYVVNLFEIGLYKEQNAKNHLMAQIIASGFLNGVFTILREVKPQEMEQEIKRLSLYYFYQSETRL
ncbi:MAG: TetR/AcrR family transcriptional regulator [Clostridia bacterium]|nr:TetR/AcrR family transcriptional regulator [Clostridia bacterium]